MKTQKQLIYKFGDPTKDNVSFENKWMVLWIVPEIIRAAIPAMPARIYGNKLMIPALEATLKALIILGLHKEIKTYNGCFNIRKKRGLSTISLHAFGLAIDLNAALNPLGGAVTWSYPFLQVWRDHGWILGADWKSRPDGMHFQFEDF